MRLSAITSLCPLRCPNRVLNQAFGIIGSPADHAIHLFHFTRCNFLKIHNSAFTDTHSARNLFSARPHICLARYMQSTVRPSGHPSVYLSVTPVKNA